MSLATIEEITWDDMAYAARLRRLRRPRPIDIVLPGNHSEEPAEEEEEEEEENTTDLPTRTPAKPGEGDYRARVKVFNLPMSGRAFEATLVTPAPIAHSSGNGESSDGVEIIEAVVSEDPANLDEFLGDTDPGLTAITSDDDD